MSATQILDIEKFIIHFDINGGGHKLNTDTVFAIQNSVSSILKQISKSGKIKDDTIYLDPYEQGSLKIGFQSIVPVIPNVLVILLAMSNPTPQGVVDVFNDNDINISINIGSNITKNISNIYVSADQDNDIMGISTHFKNEDKSKRYVPKKDFKNRIIKEDVKYKFPEKQELSLIMIDIDGGNKGWKVKYGAITYKAIIEDKVFLSYVANSFLEFKHGDTIIADISYAEVEQDEKTKVKDFTIRKIYYFNKKRLQDFLPKSKQELTNTGTT